MEDRTKGAWVLHHLNKLENVTTSADYDNIVTAGKMGTLLSTLSATEDDQLNTEQVHALAKAARISVSLELPSLLELLKKDTSSVVASMALIYSGLHQPRSFLIPLTPLTP